MKAGGQAEPRDDEFSPIVAAANIWKAMKLRTLLVALVSVLSSGCYLNSLFQSAETIEPGTGRAGVAVSFTNGIFDMPSRIGVVRNFDVGVRYGFYDHFLIDGKYQFLRDPLDGSLILGFSYNTVDAGNKEVSNRQVSRGFYPAVLFGNTTEQAGWYAGLRAIYLSQAGFEEFLVSNKTLFNDSGWIAKGIVLGGFVQLGSDVRLVHELNFLYGRNANRKVVPTIGIQLDMGK